jgi:hypothetical protein
MIAALVEKTDKSGFAADVVHLAVGYFRLSGSFAKKLENGAPNSSAIPVINQKPVNQVSIWQIGLMHFVVLW